MLMVTALLAFAATVQEAPPPPAPPETPVTSAPPVMPPPPAGVMQGTTRWRVDYAEERCVALRQYGSGPDAVTLRLTRAATLDTVTVGLFGQSLPRRDPTPLVRVGFNDASYGESAEVELIVLPDGLGRGVEYRVGLEEAAAALAAATIVRVEVARSGARAPADSVEYRLDTRQMPAILGHLERCHDQLLTDWGFDVAANRALRTRPVAIDPQNWIRAAALPNFTGRAFASTLLDVTAAGQVSACRTIDSSGVEDIDDQICRQIVRLARFEPAIGAAGVPVQSQAIQTIRYQTGRQ